MIICSNNRSGERTDNAQPKHNIPIYRYPQFHKLGLCHVYHTLMHQVHRKR